MFRDDVYQLIKDLEPAVNAINQSWANSNADERFIFLHNLIHDESFWQRTDNVAISKEFEHLKDAKTAT